MGKSKGEQSNRPKRNASQGSTVLNDDDLIDDELLKDVPDGIQVGSQDSLAAEMAELTAGQCSQ